MTADFTWMIGGPQGSGIESGANIFSRACAASGYHVFGKREFYSNIKGEHSYFAVRVSDHPVRSNVDRVTLMAAFDAETVLRHYDEVDGGIIYDVALEGIEASKVPTLDAAFLGRLGSRLGGEGLPVSVRGALKAASRAGAVLYPIDPASLLAGPDGAPPKGAARMNNVVGVSLSLGLAGMPPHPAYEAVGRMFAKKPAAAEANREAARRAYAHAATLPEFPHKLPGIPGRRGTMLVQGHYGSAIGKMVAGCRFQSYYPITPASDESVYLESNERLEVVHARPGFTSVVQTEDEISAVGMMIGAALTGVRASTSTSGPGFALMAEALGWAGINEVPVVVTLYQRSGPSTGLPTRHGQDDLLFAVHAGHGEFPRIVYASGDVEESFYDTCRCFDYADRFQVPVIHMLDKLISSSVTTCPRFDPSRVSIDRGKLLGSVDGPYRRFEAADDGISPRSRLGLPGGIFWNTGDESDEEGHITEDPQLRITMMDKRMSRLPLILEQVPEGEQAVSFGVSKYTVVSWGSAKGPVLDALEMLKREGIEVGFVQVKMIHPFPARLVSSLLEGAEVIIDVEANHTGQLGRILRQETGIMPDHHVLKYTGRGMTCTEVCGALRRIVSGRGREREVLEHGA
ncbi:MAG: 2-oxoacid:acceptor oxidoreductase subunit alpha [Nitrosopumilus sp.]|nr:2-oxoacid:acceptor oxidoreductase subunit alpha [Nitrosopumilus sp.]MDA7943724.1 2-oxoacid:acceptor oxidoreductase subunit alpha [Nitrosopumilus sp.]MDA7945623.1 2-oxoacid:acceptor oxidoreductase subunit alpha [Nitrosopumilus sp.]MDA7953402.1 2-oxoacid:acceptor oxidoreductase subunit alpha [Nitrosopumilus sp.]MDA7958240.1 2-oxoacid:acceptor oxidoreductase subunit alpha [Nitrosopumilus sp.]